MLAGGRFPSRASHRRSDAPKFCCADLPSYPRTPELNKQEPKPNNQWLKSLLLTPKTPDLKMPARKSETHALKTHA